MIKKIIIITIIILATSSEIFAMNATGSAETDINTSGQTNPNQKLDPTGLMVEFDGLVDDVKEEKTKKDNCICTMEYAPVCGQQDEDQITFSNKCRFNCRAKNTKIKFLHEGKCETKKEAKQILKQSEKIMPMPPEGKAGVKVGVEAYNTGITGGIHGINNKVPAPKEINGWVKVDNQFSFNTKTKEWKDDKGICHTCTEENGFTKDGKIVIDGKIEGLVNSVSEKNGEDLQEWKKAKEGSFVERFNIYIPKDQNDSDEDGDTMNIKSIAFGPQIIEFKGKGEVKIKDDSLFIGSAKVKIAPEKAEEKAKSSTFADEILSTKIEEDNGKINYIIETQRVGKFLGIFDFNLDSDVKVDVETGAVVDIDEPWYSFLIF